MDGCRTLAERQSGGSIPARIKTAGRATTRLAEVLEVARERGEIRADDCLSLTGHFVGMVGDNLLQVILVLRPPLSDEEAQQAVASAVEVFLNGVRLCRENYRIDEMKDLHTDNLGFLVFGNGLRFSKAELRLLSGKQANGQCCLFENISGGNTKTPIHVHAEDDETIYVIEGELTAVVNGEAHS